MCVWLALQGMAGGNGRQASLALLMLHAPNSLPCIAAPAPADPNSGGSSFSMLLGQAPHLDKQYTIFGLVSCAMLRCPVLICAAPHARVSV